MAIKTQGTELFYLSAPDTFTKIGKCTGVSATGGPSTQIDITDLDSVEEESIAGLPKPQAVSVQLNFDPADTVHQELYALWQSGAKVPWVVGLSDGAAPPTSVSGTVTYPTTRTFFSFDGYVADFPVDAALNTKVDTNMTVQRSGPKIPHWKTP